MSKKSILVPTKKAFKQVGTKAIGSAVVGAGALGAGFLDKSFGDKIPASLQKLKGVLYYALGTAVDVFVDNEHASNAGKGIATYGVMSVFNQYAPPKVKAKINSPLGANVSESEEVNWRQLAEEANSTIEGLGENTEVNTLYGTESESISKLY